MHTDNPISIAVAKAGSYSALARQMGLTYQSVRKWERAWNEKRFKSIPAERAIEIERIAGIERHLLRPDLWDAQCHHGNKKRRKD